jgi:hypothetical protein
LYFIWDISTDNSPLEWLEFGQQSVAFIPNLKTFGGEDSGLVYPGVVVTYVQKSNADFRNFELDRYINNGGSYSSTAEPIIANPQVGLDPVGPRYVRQLYVEAQID